MTTPRSIAEQIAWHRAEIQRLREKHDLHERSPWPAPTWRDHESMNGLDIVDTFSDAAALGRTLRSARVEYSAALAWAGAQCAAETAPES